MEIEMETYTTETSYMDLDLSYMDLDLSTFIGIFYVSVIVISFLLCLLGTIGNGLVIWFVFFKMKKTVNSVWFLSLAIANFTFSLYPFFIVLSIILYFYLHFGGFMCKLHYFVTYLNLCASIFQLTVISIDRYICTVFPVWCQNHRTVRLAMKVVLVLWIASLLYILYFLIKEHSSFSEEYIECFVDETLSKSDTVLEFIILFVLPFIIIMFCNLVILSRIRRNRRATSTKPFKVISAVIISFFICWFPWHLFSLIRVYKDNRLNDNIFIMIGSFVSNLLVFSNSCVNPLLYIFIGQGFKGRFCSGIKSAFERVFAEDTNLRDLVRHTTESNFIATQVTSQM